jgi:YegS/Rv2252/BmrU family lipid kinase
MTGAKTEPAVCIVNPAAGVRRRARLEARIAAELPGAVVRHTRHPGHAAEIARRAVDDGCQTVIAVGGDGTLSEAANGMLAADRADPVRLAFVPAGTCNDFARGRPVADDLRALLDPGRDQLVDVGKVTYSRPGGGRATRYFLVSCTAGLVSVIGERFTGKTPVNRVLKRLSLPLAETAAGLRVLATWRPVRLRLDLDGTELRCTATNVAVLNVPFFAGGLSFGDGTTPDDGFLDTVVVDALGRVGVLELMWRLFRGKTGDHRAVRRWPLRTVGIDAEEPIPVEVDGEIIGRTPATFTVLPARLPTVT